jgi:hypothetical protein
MQYIKSTLSDVGLLPVVDLLSSSEPRSAKNLTNGDRDLGFNPGLMPHEKQLRNFNKIYNIFIFLLSWRKYFIITRPT